MSDKIDLGKQLAQNISIRMRAKATEKATKKDIGLQEWALKYIPHYFFRGMCQLHTKLCDIADELKYKRGEKILVIAPRGNAKSTWCSLAMPIKAICEGSDKYIILCADTLDQAKKYLKSISDELRNNEQLKLDYPLACAEGDTWNTERIETASGICIEALGKGNNVRGRKFRQYRPTLFIVDDPQGDDDVISPNTRAKDVEWFNRNIAPAGDTGTNIFVIGTMLHRDCIVGNLEKRGDFKKVRFSSIIKWPTFLDSLWGHWKNLYMSGSPTANEEANAYYNANKKAMDEGAEVLWPEKEPLLALMQMREDIGYPAFASEKQNNPRDPSKCEFMEEWFEDIMYSSIPEYDEIITVGYLDPALGGDTKKHDYAPIITLHYLPKHNLIYVECDIEKRPVNITIDKMISWHKIVKYQVFGIEANGFQQLIYNELLAKAPMFPAIPIENNGIHKNTRISRLSIWLQRKFFRFKANCPYTRILLQHLKDHPHSDHDDGPDALEGAVRVLTRLIDPSNDDSDSSMNPFDDGLGDSILGPPGMEFL
jgi:hypothetical protein